MENSIEPKLVFDFKDFLLPAFNPTTLEKLNQELFDHSLIFIGIITIASIIWEHIAGNDQTYLNLLKRIFLVYFFTLIGPTVLQSGVEITINIANGIIAKYAENSQLLIMFTHEKEEMWLRVIKNLGLTLVNPLVAIIWVLCWISIFAVGHIYTLVYKLTYIAIPLSCIISIFPPTKDAVWGTIKSICWCIITPIVCAIVLAVIGVDNFNPDQFQGSINGLIQTLIYCVTIFYIPALGTMFLTSKGFQTAGEQLSGMMASSAITLGKYHILKAAASGAKLMGNGLSFTLGRPIKNALNGASHGFLESDLGKRFNEKTKALTSKLASSPIGSMWKDPSAPRVETTPPDPKALSEQFGKISVPNKAPINLKKQLSHLSARQRSYQGYDLANSTFTQPEHGIDPAYGLLKTSSARQPLTRTAYPEVPDNLKDYLPTDYSKFKFNSISPSNKEKHQNVKMSEIFFDKSYNPNFIASGNSSRMSDKAIIETNSENWNNFKPRRARLSNYNNDEAGSSPRKGNGQASTVKPDNPVHKKNHFKYDQKYWNSISDEHRGNILKKYGISENDPDPNKTYKAMYIRSYF